MPAFVKAILQPAPTVARVILTTLPYPTAAANEYIIKVRAAGITKDELGWEAADPQFFTKPRDRVPSIEGSGTVEAAPAGGAFKRGQDVFFALDSGVTGALREHANVAAEGIAPKPASLDFDQAAAVPLSALTAWQGLFEHGTLDDAAITGTGAVRDTAKAANGNTRVLVAGAAGAVGSWAVQIAAAAGAHVVGLARPAKADRVRGLGAKEVVDYAGASTLEADGKGVDLIVDTVGGTEGMKQLWGAVKDSGLFLEVGAGEPDSVRPQGKKAKSLWYLVHTSASQLRAISNLIDSASLKPVVDAVFPFDQAPEAFEKVDGGKTQGKIVINVA